MNEIMKEYKTCPECNHPWVSSHFQDGVPCPCKECGCQWSLTIKILHGLSDDMKDREGKPPEVVGSPAVERARIGEEPRKPFNVERLWIWFIVGILILFMCIKLTGKNDQRSPIEQTAGGQETMELLEEIIRLIEEGRCDEAFDLIQGGYQKGG